MGTCCGSRAARACRCRLPVDCLAPSASVLNQVHRHCGCMHQRLCSAVFTASMHISKHDSNQLQSG